MIADDVGRMASLQAGLGDVFRFPCRAHVYCLAPGISQNFGVFGPSGLGSDTHKSLNYTKP